MYFVTTFLLAILITAEARISINIKSGRNLSDLIITHSGSDEAVIGDREIELFKIDTNNLKRAVSARYNKMPTDVFLKSPTPWGDLYKRYQWKQVTRVMRIKSAKLKGTSIKTIVVSKQNFDNLSRKNITVNAGISHTVQNTVSTSWTRSRQISVSQEIDYDFNVVVAKIAGMTTFTYSSTVGRSEEKSEAVVLATSSSMEVQLKPGQAATAVLSAIRSTMSIEVEFALALHGNVAVNFKKRYNGHHFWAPTIENVLRNGNLPREVTFIENVEIGLYGDASVQVFDKKTGAALLN